MSEGTALPIADSTTTQSIFDWLERFAACVRAVDYAAARLFWHPDIIAFGTYQELIHGRARWTETQWDNVWPRTADFAFDLDNTAVLVSADGGMATVITPWTSTGSCATASRTSSTRSWAARSGTPPASGSAPPPPGRSADVPLC